MIFISRYISKVYSNYYTNYLKEHDVLNVKSCFDIGSSAGVFVDELNRLGIVAEGLEPNAKSIQSEKVKKGTFDINYNTDKKYDFITVPQVIYFLGDFEPICKKIKTMLNPKGVIFIVTKPIEAEGPITYTDIKSYPIHSEIEYKKIYFFQKEKKTSLEYKILEKPVRQ